MTHPLIPQLIDFATPLAEKLGLEVVGAVFQTNKRPPVLRVDIRNSLQDTSLDDCERMSRALEEALDTTDLIPDAYVLEISSPGVSVDLSTDRDFLAFKGFPVIVETSEPVKGQTAWQGPLIRRDEENLYLNRKGRTLAIPRHLVLRVQLEDSI